MIFITGDTHGGESWDSRKLNTKNWPEQKHCTKADTLIITGDFGYIWDGTKSDQCWLDKLNEKKLTVCFVDGNHENFQLLNQYPVVEWKGGRVHQIRDSVFHLMRGECYTIEDQAFFVLGGADSHDKQYRILGASWWPEEVPSKEELDHARQTLDQLDWKVDYILTHTCPSKQVMTLGFQPPHHDFQLFLDEMACRAEFKHWYFGHFHRDVQLDDRFTCLYQEICPLNG